MSNLNTTVDPQESTARGCRSSRKIQPHHLERTAIVYVRQSSPQQVANNKESTARQYALVDLAVQLGWPPEQVEVIDDDQGHTGSTAEGRDGFHRVLAEVSLEHVGIILGLELTRLARSNKDWHQLIELCGIFRTVLADQDGIYDAGDYNDRLLLGLRGMMSEAELHVLRGRMYQAVLNKARRGDLYVWPPVGYVKLPSGEFDVDPDEQAQGVIRLIFDQFDRIGTVRGVVRYMVEHDIKMPVRPHAGPNRGNLEWRRPIRDTVQTVITHPLFAGTYRYGYRQVDPRRKNPSKPGSGRVVMNPEDYHALIPEHCPAYISAEQYMRNQERVRENRAHALAKGAPREGVALLAGIAICGKCGRRMSVQYPRKCELRYDCRAHWHDCQAPYCQSLSGQVVDDLISEKILAVLEPAALEISLRAAEDLTRERQTLDANWKQRLERLEFAAQRAERQFHVVEPENRLVVRELEKRWESALREKNQLEQEYARYRQTQSPTLSHQERESIRALSVNLPRVWNAETTMPMDRQRIVRLLIDRVTINVQGRSDHVDVTLHWAGGFTSQHEVIRPVLSYAQMANYKQLISRIEELRSTGLSFAMVADHLNAEGYRRAKNGKPFHGDVVNALLRRHNKRVPAPLSSPRSKLLKENEWFVIELAAELKMPKGTAIAWIKRGWIRLVRQLPGYRGRMICWSDADDLERLRKLRQMKYGWWEPPLPPELTTPGSPDITDSANDSPSNS